MFVRIFNWCWVVVTLFFFMATPLCAEDGSPEGGTQIWVISYFIMILFLGLTLAILLRPTQRDDSAFSYDELKAQREEDMKKIKGAH